MDPSGVMMEVADVEVISKALRQELKQWESSFFAKHKRKAEREDIKQHPDIGTHSLPMRVDGRGSLIPGIKYKKYNDLRHPPLRNPSTKNAKPPKKRPHSSSSRPPPTTTTPGKRPKTAHNLHPSAIDPYDPPVSAHHSPITHRTSIGPTPQKDGMVLGLFDNLSSGSRSKTPSKRRSLMAVTDNVEATPSKRPSPQTGDDQQVSTGKRHRKSPLSTSKLPNPNTYLTPSASRILNSKSTPSSRGGVSILRFDETPNFLRRDSQRALTGKENTGVDEDISWSPVTARHLPKSYAGKGLSALVKGLRDMEEERLDEDLDMLREMEDGDGPTNKGQQQRLLVNDSQAADLPLGPDGGLESEDDQEYTDEGKGRDGKPLKVWKKKGQKRTTKKVVMKPNTGKWKPEPAWKGENESEDEEAGPTVQDTQILIQQTGDGGHQTGDEKHAREACIKGEANLTNGSKERGERKQGFATKIKKKISATAHANFRALKIKNKQSKGKQGGRFGRKR